MKNKNLKRRIIEISYNLKLSHISSCITAVDIIAEIYEKKKLEEKFILSAGHAHVAHAVVMERERQSIVPLSVRELFSAEENIKKHGIHCERAGGCDVSTGSLGQGLPIAVGMALADRSKNVYCLISDGECAEGSIQEALRIWEEQELWNLKIYCNFNSWGAYKKIEHIDLLAAGTGVLNVINTNMNDWPKWLQGQQGHYVVMNEEQYKEAMEVLK